MPTVDLVCSYDAAGGDAWTNGSNISTNNSSYASIGGVNFAQLKSLGFTTNAASAIPAGSTVTSIKLLVRFGGQYLCNYSVYLKNPGGFSDGGSASHTRTFYGGATLSSVLESPELSVERPAILTADLSSGQIRMFHDDNSGFPNELWVEYISLRVTYTEGNNLPFFFVNENM
jgi:hypothetical protein